MLRIITPLIVSAMLSPFQSSAKEYTYKCTVDESSHKDAALRECIYLARVDISNRVFEDIKHRVIQKADNSYDLKEMDPPVVKKLIFASLEIQQKTEDTFGAETSEEDFASFLEKTNTEEGFSEDIESLNEQYRRIVKQQRDFILEQEFYKQEMELALQTDTLENSNELYKRKIKAIDQRVEAYNNLVKSYDKIYESLRLYSRRENKAALSLLKKIMVENPESVIAAKMIGYILTESKQYEGALMYLLKASKSTQDPYLMTKLGFVQYKNDNFQESLNSYLTSQKLFPEYEANYLRVAELYMKKRDFDAAFNQVLRLLSLNPESYEALTLAGEIYFNKHEMEKAVERLNSSLKINPNYAKTHEVLGDISYYRGEKDLAKEQYRNSLLKTPDDAQLQQKFKAISGGEKLKFLSPIGVIEDGSDIYNPYNEYNVANSSVFKVEPQSDLSNFANDNISDFVEPRSELLEEEGLTVNEIIDEDGAAESIKRGIELVNREQEKKAKNYFLTAIEQNHRNCESYFYIGLINYMDKKWDVSAKFLEESLKFGCSKSYTNENIKSNFKLKEKSESDKNDYQYDTHIMLGFCYKYMNDISRSSSNFIRAAGIYPNSAQTNYEAGRISADIAALTSDSNRLNIALDFLRKSTELGSVDAQILLGRLKVEY